MEFTEDQLKKLRQTFEAYRQTAEGAEELNRLFGKLNQEGVGALNFDQLLEMAKPHEDCNENDVRAAFRVFDKKGDGFLSGNDVRLIMTSMGDHLTAEECNEILHDADCKDDGPFDYEKFIASFEKK